MHVTDSRVNCVQRVTVGCEASRVPKEAAKQGSVKCDHGVQANLNSSPIAISQTFRHDRQRRQRSS